MEDSRAAERAFRDTGEGLTRLMQELNATFLPLARKYGVRDPRDLRGR